MKTFLRLEQCLLPPPETVRWDRGQIVVERYTSAEKVGYCVKNFFLFIVYIIASPITLIADYFESRKVEELPRVRCQGAVPEWPPEQRGFAMSFFQTSGLGTKYGAPEFKGKCDWDEWMDGPHHVIQPPLFDRRKFFTDILSDPDRYIEILKAHNVTAARFSLEWSIIKPAPNETSVKAVQLYRNFIDKLIAAGITPSITLNHFVVPDWFYRAGNFQKRENIDAYVDFALEAMRLFPNVKDWWSFNELGIKAFQQTREVYPTDLPEGSPLPARVHAAGTATLNMLIAHCKLHKAASEKHPDKKLGVTHQWLKFDTEQGNPVEKAIAYFFTKFAFIPVYRFFKEGKFSFQIPFMANIQFEMPKEEFEANNHFLTRLGVQAYPKAMLKMGLNSGETYPGLPSSIKNFRFFSFGSSCEPGGVVMRFGPRWNAEAMNEILDEAYALTDQVFITEFGSDAKIWKWGAPGFRSNDQAQKEYLEKLLREIRKYGEQTGRELKGIFCWSDLRYQMEWENGFDCELGLIKQRVNGKTRQIEGWNQTAGAQYIASVYKREEEEERKTAS